MAKKLSKKEDRYRKLISFLLIHLFIIGGGLISLLFKLNYLWATVITLIPPTIYLLWLLKKLQNKIIVQSLLFNLPIIVVTDMLAHINHAWYENTMFSQRIFGLFPYETLIWGISYGIFIVAFYEYFFDTQRQKKFNKVFKYAVVAMWALLGGVLVAREYAPYLLNIQYFYTTYIAIFILLDAFSYIKYKQFGSKALIAGLLLIPLSICNELVSLSLGHWYFPLQSNLMYVHIAGHPIPVEELLWFTVIPMAIISVYEILADNHRA